MTAEKMAREEALEIAVTKTDFIPDGWYPYNDILTFGADCYLAGQQSLWREYPKEKPPLGEKVLLFDKVSRSKVIGWLEDYQDEDGEHVCHFVDGEGDVVFQGNNDMPSHWMPITLPATKEGAE